MVSIILPTYNEAENIKLIVSRLFQELNGQNISFEIIVVDDNSPDGTAIIALALAKVYPVKVYLRENERGLASAVMKGLELTNGDICIVMDADLSHPVEKVPEMIKPILEGKYEATIGSRYIKGGGFENWPLIRRMISRGAGILAKGVTKLSDPTSGFMGIRKTMLYGVKLNPVGWKIVLEVIVKTNARFKEIPIVFADRKKGKSKLSFRAQVAYINHLWHLYKYRYPTIFQFITFCLVGFSGLLIDTAILVSCVEILTIDPRFAATFAFLWAVTWNYSLNRMWTFEKTKVTWLSSSYFSFVFICSLGLGIRIGAMHLLMEYAGMAKSPWYILASLLSIIFATMFNFVGSKYITFSDYKPTDTKTS